MIEKLGIAIITHHCLPDLQAAVESIVARTTPPYDLVVWDNSEDWRTGEWASLCERMTYIRSPYNVGCCVSRNALATLMLKRGISHWVVMDQDVTITAPGWAEDMLAVFAQYPDTGIVAWKCIADQLQAHYDMDATGATPQVPGACCMVSGACVRAVGGWYPGALFNRLEDSDFCFQAGLKGFKTRLVLGEQRIAHTHPGSGMARHPRANQVGALSDAIFQQRAHAFGYPLVSGVTAP